MRSEGRRGGLQERWLARERLGKERDRFREERTNCMAGKEKSSCGKSRKERKVPWTPPVRRSARLQESRQSRSLATMSHGVIAAL
jgi:hypothetical protein